MANPGAYPVDITTPVGQVRANVGDTQSVPLDPVVAGQQDYEWMSDLEIEGYLATGSNNVMRATGFAFLHMATIFTIIGDNVKTDDLAINDGYKAADFRALATEWFGRADATDAVAAHGISGISPFVPAPTCLYGLM